ncbi:alpha/beta fold hydrolase [Pseudaestuariivita sp.]|uniref:alpha/beta fold hydrolase n=1 Tax=Pseudaestuariivita sp. TaxID=2211669 RepID=UPI004059B891
MMDRQPQAGSDDTGTDALVAAIYQVTVDPDANDKLMALWGDYLEAQVRAQDAAGRSAYPPGQGAIADHLLRAFDIHARMGRTPGAVPEAEVAELQLSAEGRVTSCNRAGSEALGVSVGATVELTGRAGDSIVVATGASGLSAAMVVTERRRGRKTLRALHGRWTAQHDAAVQRLYDLTAAETRVAAALLQGLSLRDIAQSTGRGIETIRSQLKAVQRKTRMPGQTQLVRLLTGLQHVIDATSGDAAQREARVLVLPDGRKLHYALYGPRTGRPCLMLHNMLNGPYCLPPLVEALKAENLRLICPWRPGFGDSDLDKGAVADPPSAPGRLSADLGVLCARLGVSGAVVAGHMSGSLYAYDFAKARPDLVKGVLAVSGGVPIRSMAQIFAMERRQRTVALTTRWTPRLLPAILRSGIAQIDARGMDAFLAALYPAGSVDAAAAAADPALRDMLYAGFQNIVKQGHQAFEIDAHQVVRDWSDNVNDLAAPVYILHGRHDPVVTFDSARDYASRIGATFTGIEDAGQLLWWTHPALIARHLSALHDFSDRS